jgi:hypothetical protein
MLDFHKQADSHSSQAISPLAIGESDTRPTIMMVGRHVEPVIAFRARRGAIKIG